MQCFWILGDACDDLRILKLDLMSLCGRILRTGLRNAVNSFEDCAVQKENVAVLSAFYFFLFSFQIPIRSGEDSLKDAPEDALEHILRN